MESIDIKGKYVSNNFPLIRFYINNTCIDNIKAHRGTFEYHAEFDAEVNTFTIEHYGKNYIKDSDPDTFFDLTELRFNNLSVMPKLKQYPLLPPWDGVDIPEWEDNSRLGHNGKLVLEFTLPFRRWMLSHRRKINHKDIRTSSNILDRLKDTVDYD